jgi:hypothetical protein
VPPISPWVGEMGSSGGRLSHSRWGGFATAHGSSAPLPVRCGEGPVRS